ncbi:uncharacterized protein si:dkey-193c22.1 isoform X2 [Betta splendens]|uniref:Uncharacterized protein si:dkey-193c22.1 isoform X2 n=1 Tax=Betta splendens TaxID=158456 RepID=A0A6P7NNY8_BETSP|nr:uncharacterized protein si:dkey-193c22.1 isoform X2 [Betta splendens]
MSGLRDHMSVPVAVGVLLVGVPYSVSIAVQWFYGWPIKPGYKKYIEALKPRRIYTLTRAVLETLKYLQYGRLYIQWKSWYNNNKNHKHFKKGITFGRRSNKLDLYYPPHERMAGDILTPLVVFVYGGAWGSGERTIYCLLAKQMADELNATVICPDYCIYPKGNVLGMVQDIADCLVWAQENGEKFNFDKDSIVLIGHSAGAHLCALTTLFLTDTRDELFIELSQQQDITRAVRGVIGLSGVYDIMEHYKHEQKRAVEYISSMHKAMNGVENFAYYSPTHVVKNLNQDKLDSSLSVKVSLLLLPKVNHTEMVTDIMAPNRFFYQLIYGCIKQEFRKLLGT